jgi:hypothetical protein
MYLLNIKWYFEDEKNKKKKKMMMVSYQVIVNQNKRELIGFILFHSKLIIY